MTPAPGSASAEPDTAAAGADGGPGPVRAPGLEPALVSGLRSLRQGLSPFSRDVAGTAHIRFEVALKVLKRLATEGQGVEKRTVKTTAGRTRDEYRKG